MKRLIRLAITVTIFAVFMFSSNSYIATFRGYVLRKGAELYPRAIEMLKSSDNQTIASIGEKIE